MGRDLAADNDCNFWACWRELGSRSRRGAVHEDEHALVVRTGSPVGSLNPVFVKGTGVAAPAAADAVVRRVLDSWPAMLAVRADHPAAPTVGVAAVDAGLVPGSPLPAMAVPLDAVEPRPAPPELRVRKLARSRAWQDYVGLLCEAFDVPADAAGALADKAAYRSEAWTLLAGEVDGVLVATAASFVTGDVAGVYNVATRPAARGRGYGEALTWAAIDVGRRRGAAVSVLQATPMGEPVYARMGFRVVADYLRFG